MGAEVFHQTAQREGEEGGTRFNMGLVLDLSDLHHLLFSAGRSLGGATLFQGYAAYQLTL